MIIHFSKVNGVVNAIEAAVFDQKKWLGINAKIQSPDYTDLHFFITERYAQNFQEFNVQQGIKVTLLPTIITLDAIHEIFEARLKDGNPQPNVQLNPDELMQSHHQYEMMLTYSALMEEMDGFNWAEVFYDPLEANSEAESFEDKVTFNRLETLVENLSALATVDDFTKRLATNLVNRYWKGQPMEAQIEAVLDGKYWPISKANIYSTINSNPMNMENLSYLKKLIKDTGFGESLYPELERNIREKNPEFQLPFTTQVRDRPYNALLDFRKSDSSDMYFFNRYHPSLERFNGEKVDHTFEIRKGQGVRANVAYNFLQGRPIRVDLTNSKGEPYKKWMQFDFDKPKDDNGKFQVNGYSDNYGYNLRDELGRLPLKELDGGKKEQELIRSMERGYFQAVTIEKDGKDLKLYVEANPGRKTINVYDENFVMKKHEELPFSPRPQSDTQQSQAATNVVSKNETQQQAQAGPKNGKGQTANQSNNNTGKLQKKRTSKKKGIGM